MQLGHPLLENRIEGRNDFSKEYVALLEDNPGVLNVIWFYDEARFYSDRCINKQMLDLGPQRIQRVQLSIQCIQRELQHGTLSSVGIFDPVFTDGMSFLSD
jgi:hypothetical protein